MATEKDLEQWAEAQTEREKKRALPGKALETIIQEESVTRQYVPPIGDLKMYFIQKEGVYYHGIFWIGYDEEEGRKKAELLASRDDDDYHEWVLYRFIEQTDIGWGDPEHEELHKVRKRI